MIGFWKGNRKPVTTTADNFFDNFIFYIPRPGFEFFLGIGLIVLIFLTVFRPTYEYKYSDYYTLVEISYDKWFFSNKVNGELTYYYDVGSTHYKVETKFTGTINGNRLTIELDNNEIRSNYVGPQGTIEKRMELIVKDGEINFKGLITKGGRTSI